MPPRNTSLKEERIQFADNPEPRCPCILLLDTSASMKGERIQALNEGLQTLRSDVRKDGLAARRIEIAIVTFGSSVEVIQSFVTADRFRPPTLTTAGQTHMGAGLTRALELVRARKEIYRRNGIAYYRPWVFMITDGKPEGESEAIVKQAARRVRSAEKSKHATVFAIAVAGADMTRLGEIVVRPPLELEALDFNGLFLWLSASMQSVSRSGPGDTVALPPIGWMKRISLFIEKHDDVIKDGVALTRMLAKVAGVPI
jgi:uncharacterized protein YegL